MDKIEFVKGLLITPNGEKHAFGTHVYEKVDKRTNKNYHDSAFVNEVLPTPWFQELMGELGIKYDTNKTIHSQWLTFAAKGIIALINASDLNSIGEEYNVYCIHAPQTLTENQREILENDYEKMKDLLERKHAYFEGVAYDKNEDYVFFVYGLDEFYDEMNLRKTKGHGKSR